MTTSRQNTDTPGPTNRDADFDRRLRARYADATLHLSARTHAQLQQRLRAAIAQRPRGRNRGRAWIFATACSLALVTAFGLQWRAQDPSTPRAPAPIADTSDNSEIVATLEETPDLYLWLASDDAIALASE
jgi:hypothetical protein